MHHNDKFRRYLLDFNVACILVDLPFRFFPRSRLHHHRHHHHRHHRYHHRRHRLAILN